MVTNKTTSGPQVKRPTLKEGAPTEKSLADAAKAAAERAAAK